MNTNIRKARIEDVGNVEELMYSSGTEFYDYLYKSNSTSAQEYIALEFLSGAGTSGFNNVTVIESDATVLGAVCFYTGVEQKALTRGSVKNIFKYLGVFGGVRALFAVRHLVSMITIPQEDELYIMNLGIKEECQGQGLGTKLIEHIISRAPDFEANKVSLDVATNNPMAEKLYSRLGFKVVNTIMPPDIVAHLPGSKKMEMIL